MKAQIIYVKGHAGSEAQSLQALTSFEMFGWDAERIEGVTPDTLQESDFPYPDTPGSRMSDFKSQGAKYYIKKACLFNNLKFAQRVLDADEPMAFIEHDALAIEPPDTWDFTEFLSLSYEYAFQPPTCLNKSPYTEYKLQGVPGTNPFPVDYPVQYYHPALYKGARLTPGTAAYALTPEGAERLLDAAATNGLEQSDYIINSHNLDMQFVWPSPVKYNNENLNLSHGL